MSEEMYVWHSNQVWMCPWSSHKLPLLQGVGVQMWFLSFWPYRYAVDIPGGLGPTAGKVWRVGLMGYNSTRRNADTVIKIVREFLQSSSSAVSKL